MPARRKRPGQFSEWMHTYIYHRAEAKIEERVKEQAAEKLRSWVKEHGGVAANGNIEYRLPQPLEAEGKTYYGMELRKSQQTLFDYSAAEKLAVDKGWSADDYGHYEFIIDQDAFLVANQQGKLSDDELDALLVDQEPTYSLWPLEKPKSEEGDDE